VRVVKPLVRDARSAQLTFRKTRYCGAHVPRGTSNLAARADCPNGSSRSMATSETGWTGGRNGYFTAPRSVAHDERLRYLWQCNTRYRWSEMGGWSLPGLPQRVPRPVYTRI